MWRELSQQEKYLLLLGALVLFSFSLIYFGYKMSSLFTAAPIYACHYGTWDVSPYYQSTIPDPHNRPNSTEYLRRGDDFECIRLSLLGRPTPMELCNSSFPFGNYSYVVMVGPIVGPTSYFENVSG